MAPLPAPFRVLRRAGLGAVLLAGALGCRCEPSDRGGRGGAAASGDGYAEHIAALQRKLPHPGFHVVVQPPFVVVGDQPAAVVRRYAQDTVGWAVALLKKEYFERDPDGIIDIWLFRDRHSYERHARELFGETPVTRFGYYSPQHRALVMNIATGGGTLVHEIVHPYVAANFPQCPAWFNEGLGSLYEQCAARDGRIVGLTNWRLPSLQEVIRAGAVPSFAELTGTTDADFYGAHQGTYYAQARYLCFYLQEKGLLRAFYRAFRAGHADDPTGYETLQRVLGRRDMSAFQREWEAFVLQLEFR